VPPTYEKWRSVRIPKRPRVDDPIPEVDPGASDEPVDNSLVVGASGNELLLEKEVEGELHQFLIDSGASLSLMKPGVSQAEVRPTDLAARGITGTKLKSIGTQEIEFRLGSHVYTHEFLVTSLDVEYSGVFGLDILRQMEAKVDLCSSGLIIGRRRYILTGLDDQDHVSPQVTVTKPVATDEWGTSGLINPTGPTREGEATGEQGAGKPANLDDRELNPDDPVTYNNSHNTMSIVLA
jgi:hypothetical protein